MSELKINSNPKVKIKFDSYPEEVREKLSYLRDLIFDVANNIDTLDEIEETLKWGEPSYLVKKGSTIRMDWKSKSPEQYAMYFKCTSKLVPTFKEVFGDIFNYENNRAIHFSMDDKIPEKELRTCIALALQYHNLKHLPQLGQ